MNEDFRTFLNEQEANTLLDGFPKNLSTEHNLTPEQFEEVKRNQSIPDNDPLTGEPWNAGLPKAGDSIPMPPDYTPEPEEEEIIDEETGEVTTITKAEPSLTPASDGKGYKAIVITMSSDEEDTRAEIEHRALSNPALAEAIAKGKKTWEGFFRFWHNKTREAHKAYNFGQSALVVPREQVWDLAEEYFLNDNLRDTQAPATKPKKQPKPKAGKPKAEPKPKKETKVVPLTPQMGSLFGDEDFQ